MQPTGAKGLLYSSGRDMKGLSERLRVSACGNTRTVGVQVA